MFVRRLARLSVLVASLAMPAMAAAQEPTATSPVISVTPTAFVQERADAIIAIVNRAAAAPEERDARVADLRSAVGTLIDFEVLAQRTLGDEWNNRTQPERDQFLGLLRTLVELSYSRRMGTESVDPGSYSVTYTGERERNGRFTVEGTLNVRGEEHFIEVRMLPSDSGYIIFDVITDDVSLEESYQESFSNIIQQHGWGELIARMERRIADLRD